MAGWYLAVDLGTSFSAGAVGSAAGVEVLLVGGERTVPSTVLLTEGGELVAGGFAERAVGRYPDRAERNPKRNVGRGPMLLGGEPVTSEAALGALLSLFLTEAREQFPGAEPDRLVLTHPVAWGTRQRDVLRQTGELVLPGVPVDLLEEPTAAAHHYAQDHGLAPGSAVAVYDLGGGTFDTAVLAAREDGSFEVVGRPGGDAEIGGENFDDQVFETFGTQLEKLAPDWWEKMSSSSERRWLAAGLGVAAEARLARESLSEFDSAAQWIEGAAADVHITRAELEDLITHDVGRTVRLLADTIAGSGRTLGQDLRAVYLTGGASRTPLVRKILGRQYGDMVTISADPKTVVALGAAHWALRTRPLAPAVEEEAARQSAAGELPVVLDGVLDASVAGEHVYALCAGRIVRIAPRSGQPVHQIALAEVVSWAVSDELVLVCEKRDGRYWLHGLSPELIIRSTTELRTSRAPRLVADGPTGWAFVRAVGTNDVDTSSGLPWGEDGELHALVYRPDAPFPAENQRVVPLGRGAFWHVNEDGRTRRLLDLSGPTGGLPSLLGDGSAALVVGRHARKWAVRRTQSALEPRQAVLCVTSERRVWTLAERSPSPTTPWIHQVLRANGLWYLATSYGLETATELKRGLGRLEFVPSARTGAAMWVPAGRTMFGVVLDQVVGNQGLTLHALADDTRRDLGRWAGMLGNPASVRAAERPRLHVDGETLWIAASDGSGSSVLIRADRDTATAVLTARGWLEPVGRAGGVLVGIQAPDVPPGDARTTPGRLVRLPD